MTLEVVIKEAFRMHPAIEFSQERVLAKRRATICFYSLDGYTSQFDTVFKSFNRSLERNERLYKTGTVRYVLATLRYLPRS